MASYTVKKGDNLTKIAKNNGVTLQSLLSANPGIKNPNLIYPGQSITIPSIKSAVEKIIKKAQSSNSSPATPPFSPGSVAPVETAEEIEKPAVPMWIWGLGGVAAFLYFRKKK